MADPDLNSDKREMGGGGRDGERSHPDPEIREWGSVWSKNEGALPLDLPLDCYRH